MRFLGIVGGVALATLGVAAIVLFAGVYDVAADEPHWPATLRVMEWARARSVERGLKEVPAAPNLRDEALLRRGAANYSEMCAVCHSAPGAPESPLRQGLYPKPPDFTRATVPPERAFWTIKHGVKMTGMPAWGLTHDDPTIWSMVAFIERLPKLSKPQYEELVASAPLEEAMPGGHTHGSGARSHMHPDGKEHMHK